MIFGVFTTPPPGARHGGGLAIDPSDCCMLYVCIVVCLYLYYVPACRVLLHINIIVRVLLGRPS